MSSVVLRRVQLRWPSLTGRSWLTHRTPVNTSLQIALREGDSAGVLGAVGDELAAGCPAADLARVGLRFLLECSGWELRGARWSHAFLALEAAHQLALVAPDEVAEPAVTGALAFLDGSVPTRQRPLDPALSGIAPSGFEAAVRRGDLEGAESALVALSEAPHLRSSDLEKRWFSLAASNVEGWGHRSLMAMSTWRLEAAGDFPKGWLLRAGLRHWLPWEPESESNAAAPGTAPGPIASVSIPDFVGTAVLTGCGPDAVTSVLRDGAAPAQVVDGLLQAACRSFSALPELRQLHSVTVGRALAEAVLYHGVPAEFALPRFAAFVAEGWQLGLRSQRVPTAAAAPVLGEPEAEDGGDLDDLAAVLCRRDATPNFGHLIKLVEASYALRGLMSEGLGERWVVEVFRFAESKATRYGRVWATVARRRAGKSF